MCADCREDASGPGRATQGLGEAVWQPQEQAAPQRRQHLAHASKDVSQVMGTGGGFKGRGQCDQRAAAQGAGEGVCTMEALQEQPGPPSKTLSLQDPFHSG